MKLTTAMWAAIQNELDETKEGTGAPTGPHVRLIERIEERTHGKRWSSVLAIRLDAAEQHAVDAALRRVRLIERIDAEKGKTSGPEAPALLAASRAVEEPPTLLNLQERITGWHQRQFPTARPYDNRRKLLEETEELQTACIAADELRFSGYDADGSGYQAALGHLAEEAADVLIVLLALCGTYAVDLEAAVLRKQHTNETAAWDPETGRRIKE